MKRDILGQLELSIIQTDMAIIQTSDLEEKRCLSDKVKTLEAKRSAVADECANILLAIGNLIQNPPQTASASPLTPSAPPGLLHRVLPPPPPPTPTTSNTQVPTTPNTSPPKRLIPPHMDMPTPPEKDEPAKKKQRSNVVSRKSMEGECRVTRSATLTSLQVTSQSALEDDEVNTVMKDAFGAVKMNEM